MKNFEEMSQNVLKRRDEEIELKKHRRKNAVQIALSCTASVAALAVIAGAIDWARYKQEGKGLFFGAGSGNSNGNYTHLLASEIAPDETRTNRQNVPDDIKFVWLDDFMFREDDKRDPEYFYPMTLEELNNRYGIDFEALNDVYSDWEKVGSLEYGEYIDYGNDGEVAWKKIIWTENEIGYLDYKNNQEDVKQVFVLVRQDNFPVYEGDTSDYSSVVAGWQAKFYETYDNRYTADVRLDYGNLRVFAMGISQEEFIKDVRAVLKADEFEANNPEVTQQTVSKTDVYDYINFTELDEVVPLNFDGTDGINLDPDKRRELTLEELNAKYNINFEALEGVYSDWIVDGSVGKPYVEYWETEFIEGKRMLEWPIYTRIWRMYSEPDGAFGLGKHVSVIVQHNEFPSPTTNHIAQNSSIKGHSAQFYKHKDGIRDCFLAYVTLENGYLRVTSIGISEEEFIEDVRAVLNTDKAADGDWAYWDLYGKADFDPEKNLNIFIPWTLDELNEWYGINFEALNELLPEWDAHHAPYGEFHSAPGTPESKTVNYTQNGIAYTRECDHEGYGYPSIDVLVQLESFSLRGTVTHTKTIEIDGKQVEFISYNGADRFSSAVVALDFGWLQVNTGGGLTDGEFESAVRAILTGEVTEKIDTSPIRYTLKNGTEALIV